MTEGSEIRVAISGHTRVTLAILLFENTTHVPTSCCCHYNLIVGGINTVRFGVVSSCCCTEASLSKHAQKVKQRYFICKG